ncbi:DUF4180 domain-containing protein [Spirillospora sp. NPDC047279]|uniref:DUF4180 domain-containing protein n=1 Tax=Spirillospora sp. NPDC047279 TaxID=3155478 RepID=UPI0033FFE46B
MVDGVARVGVEPVYVCSVEGAAIEREADALDLIGNAGEARWVAVPVERLGEDFFRLRTRVAGDIVQKFAQYGRALAVVGDISAYVERSDALRDFVRECNRGRQTWFVGDLDELAARLS